MCNRNFILHAVCLTILFFIHAVSLTVLFALLATTSPAQEAMGKATSVMPQAFDSMNGRQGCAVKAIVLDGPPGEEKVREVERSIPAKLTSALCLLSIFCAPGAL
jgi:hypothetical protein